jgi:uncharacterized protein YchJ
MAQSNYKAKGSAILPERQRFAEKSTKWVYIRVKNEKPSMAICGAGYGILQFFNCNNGSHPG